MKIGEIMNFINKDLLNYFKSKPKEEVKLDINIELIGESSIKADFKIGIDRMYALKNIREFAYSRTTSKDIVYGLDFVYNVVNNYFSYDDEKIVDMIEEYGMGLSYNSSSIE